MKPVQVHVTPSSIAYGESELLGMRTTDVCNVGMVIRRPKDYSQTIQNLPTGRALRRLLAKQNRGRTDVR